MTSKGKQVSSPISTGGAGVQYEANIHAMFMLFMLTKGRAPLLPYWPIKQIEFQTRRKGYYTDDVLVVVENLNGHVKRLLGQIKLSISVTKTDKNFKEALQGAWLDFNNSQLFNPNNDTLALITKHLGRADQKSVKYILKHAKSRSSQEFFNEIDIAKYSPAKAREKLEVFRFHLTQANNDNKVSDEALYQFLRNFELLEVSLDDENGLDSSLLHSFCSLFNSRYPIMIWGRLVDFALTNNKSASTLTIEDIPNDIIEYFQKEQTHDVIPKELIFPKVEVSWKAHPNAAKLALIALIGGWNEHYEDDIEVLETLLDLKYKEEWLPIAQQLLNTPNSPLKLSNGIWRVTDKENLLQDTASQILDQHLDTFKDISILALSELDPVFELPKKERFFADIHGKNHPLSETLIAGIADGLALLGCRSKFFHNVSQNRAENTVLIVMRKILENAPWERWATLNSFLPILAESAPEEFMKQVENTLNNRPEIYTEIYAQEEDGSSISSSNYLTGLLWALENLAWKEEYLVRVVNILAELAKLDPGGQWANRPDQSLVTIFLPWSPQTLASVKKRKVAINTIIQNNSEIAWKVLLQLLPNPFQTTMGSHKTKWLLSIPDKVVVTKGEYWEMVSFFAELAVEQAQNKVPRILRLIKDFDRLPKNAFKNLVGTLKSLDDLGLSVDEKREIWETLSVFVRKHRRHSDTDWALPEELLTTVDSVIKMFTPESAFNRYQCLFAGSRIDSYEETGDWEEQSKKLTEKRKKAIQELLYSDGLDRVVDFAEVVSESGEVGHALASIGNTDIDNVLLPEKLSSDSFSIINFIASYVWKRREDKNWVWVEQLDTLNWTTEEKAQLLAYLPFKKAAWEQAKAWSKEVENKYWNKVYINPYHTDYNLSYLVEKLLEYCRFKEAIDVLWMMTDEKENFPVELAVRILIEGLEDAANFDFRHAAKIIEALQKSEEVADEDLFRIEWSYLLLLERGQRYGVGPDFLENKIASDPDFFCELIKLVYRSTKQESKNEETLSEEEKLRSGHTYMLLEGCNRIPGTTKTGDFNSELFECWIEYVKESTRLSGHYDVAMSTIGKILFKSPEDKSGLWIDKTIAGTLNQKDDEEMREGFYFRTINRSGMRYVDPEGKPEKELAEQYRQKGDDLENEGFHRFGTTLLQVAEYYESEAERYIQSAKDEN